jgi:PPOX class probable F420-dependent enzyme
MDETLKKKILSLLDGHHTMRIATIRPDGWPQVTTVGYANEGFSIYFLCGPDSQKAANLARDNRVSLAIDDDTPQVMEITGLSIAARAEVVHDTAEAARVMGLLFARYPEQKSMPGPLPAPKDVCIVRLKPTVISLLDYAKGFGHTDLVSCS